MYVTRIQARGTITVPQEIRERFGLKPGTDIAVEPHEDGTFLCIPLRRPMTLDEALERFSRTGSAPSQEDMEQLRSVNERDFLGVQNSCPGTFTQT